MDPLLFLSLLANLIALVAGVMIIWRRGGVEYLRSRFGGQKLSPITDMVYYEQRQSLLSTLRQSRGTMFIGDSLTECGEWNELLPWGEIQNRGIGGDTTAGLLERLPSLLACTPSRMFLMIGINDLGARVPIKNIVENYTLILRRIEEGCPDSAVFLQSLLPVAEHRSNPYSGTVSNQDVRALNEELGRLSVQFRTTFIDLFPHFLDEKELHRRYTNDGLHLTGEGYAHWSSLLRALVQ
jgi:lysophospholipase L1-like esterase